MVKKTLMLGAAFAALSMIPVEPASANDLDFEIDSEWSNKVDVELEWEVDVEKELSIDGTITIEGTVSVSALSQATLDDKQALDENEVQFEDYQNTQSGNLGISSEPDVGASGAHPAVYTNSVSSGLGTLENASGNVGLNMAAGDYNLQENAGVLSSAEGVDGSGAAEAGSFSLQALYDNGFNDAYYELQNTEITNSVSIGAGTGNGAEGNIGLNAAAGAFNIQKNALVIATLNGGNLAEATAGTEQYSKYNDSVHEDVDNDVSIGGSLQNVSGNVGVNLASGVGNLQLNSLTIANALAFVGIDPTTDPTTDPNTDPFTP